MRKKYSEGYFKKIINKTRKISLGKVLNVIALGVIVMFSVSAVWAATPNPGHPWTDIGDGTFQVTGPTALRTYTFPDASATMVTSNSFAQGDIIYGSSAGVVSQLAKNTSASRYLSNTGSSNNPAWAQVDLTNGVTGILPATNGGTGNGFTAFSGPSASTKTFTLPNASANILTDSAPVTLTQGGTGVALTASAGGIVYSGASTLGILGGTATAGQMLQSGASAAPTWSTATYPATAGTLGNSLVSDGTNWTSVNVSGPYLFPVGFAAGSGATTMVTNTSYFVYIGKARKAYTSCTVNTKVTTAAATVTWAEVGIFKGSVPAWGGAASLSRLGFTSVAATYNSTGVKSTAVTVSGVTAGDDLWVAYGNQSTTVGQIAGAAADNSTSGLLQTFAGRISTMSVPTTTSIAANTLVAGWLGTSCT